MGATSVTGRGVGSAEGMNKGTDRMTLGTTHLIGPHAVAAGVATLSGSTGAVQLPTLPGVVADYSVQLTANTSASVHVTALTLDGFTINGTTGQNVHWLVMRNGL